ncbi:MAG TPA: hypothetical protein VM260_14160, partial [Pirellula sp.]|nr:hypothetical protein [Pirellula sp.]
MLSFSRFNSHVVSIAVLIGFLSPTCQASTDSELPLPHWIWTSAEDMTSSGENPAKTPAIFQRELEVNLPVRTAIIRLAADFCHATVIINERLIFAIEPYSQTVQVDVTGAMQLGKNNVRIEAIPISGPSAIAASLSVGVANESKNQSIVTDDSWNFALRSGIANSASKMKPIVSLGTVTPELWEIGRRSSKVEPTENY